MNQIPYWAKTDNGRPDGRPSTALLTHSTHAGLAGVELVKGSAIEAALQLVAVLGPPLHDVGKATLGFGNKSDIWRELYGTQDKYLCGDHMLLGSIILRWEFGLPLWIVKAIAVHHGRLVTDSAPGARAVYGESNRVKDILQILSSLPLPPDREKARAGTLFPTGKWNQLVSTVCERLGIEWPQAWPAEPSATQSWLIMGLCVISDWVASSVPGEPGEYLSPKSLETCRAEVRSVLKTLQLREPVKMLGSVDSFQALTGKPPRACQRIEYRGPGVYVIEAPTGAGKTEIAIDLSRQLIQGEHAKGLFFTLPTRISSKEIFGRIQKLLDGKTESTLAKLVHSTSWIEDVNFLPVSVQDGDEFYERGRWLNGRRKGLLSPIGAGPLDQVLLAFVRSKFFFLRLWALQQKVIIVDELHSYSPYMLQLLAQALPTLKELGCTVIILSATLTQRAKTELLSASGLTNQPLPERASNSQALHVDWTGSVSVQPLDTNDCTAHPEVKVYKHRTALDVNTAGYQTVIDQALQCAREGEKVLWICNTVRAAQGVYAYAQATGTQVPLGLIHSRYTATDRRRREKQWLEFFANESGGCLLIGTQVLEQSIDLDSDRLFTELAPIDLIIQRAGRLWRKFRSSRIGQAAPLHVLLPVSRNGDDFGGGWKVYDNRFELLRAQRILPDRFDKNMAWKLLELDTEPQTVRETELVARYREQVERELLLAIARGVSMDEVLMEDDEGDGGNEDDPPEDFPVVRLTKIPTVRICIMRDSETFWDGSKRAKRKGLLPRELFQLRKAVELNTVGVPIYLFTRDDGTLFDEETRTQTWIFNEQETRGGLSYNSQFGASPV